MAASQLRMLAGVGLACSAAALDNGLGLKPPMGWRSWNLFGENVDQKLMEATMDGMVARKRLVDGKPTSFCDLGFCDVGLDDNWQDCNAGADGLKYHVREGDSFRPAVNLQRFPDLAAMTKHAHDLGLTAGWYGNNCICREDTELPTAAYEGDVRALVQYGFDGIKLDNCGKQGDLELWADLINQTGRAVVIENCHWGETVPTETWCPWHFFRSSQDIRANYGSVMGNLQTTIQWAQQGLSKPGCWAYPDALQIGVAHGPGGDQDPGLTEVETRSHFGAWCITSSPLVIAFDVNNDTVVDAMWPLVSNAEAIAINQAWAGHSGSPFKQSKSVTDDGLPVWQFFYKPLGGGEVAVLLLNHGARHMDTHLQFSSIPGLSCTTCHVRDVWEQADMGTISGSLSAHLAPHDSAFLVLSDATASVVV